MKSALNCAVRTEGSATVKRDCLHDKSVVPSNELLRQFSDLIDGLINLSAPFKCSLAASDETNEWTPQDYVEKLIAISGSERAFRNASMPR